MDYQNFCCIHVYFMTNIRTRYWQEPFINKLKIILENAFLEVSLSTLILFILIGPICSRKYPQSIFR